MRIFTLIITVFIINTYATTLDTLLQDVNTDVNTLQKEDASREKAFLSDLNKAKKQLSAMKSALKKENAKTERLKTTFKTQKERIRNYNLELEKKSENLKDVFTITKQEARDFKSLLDTSMTSTQYKTRGAFLETISLSHDNPNIETIREFWQKYLQEIIASGKIVSYETELVNSQGTQEKKSVTRIGLFSAFDDHQYLRYDDSLHEFVQLMRQPTSSATEYIKKYNSASSSEIVPALIDPTRGVLFDMLKERATIMERIEQGGIIGYVILTLGALTLLYSLIKFISLMLTDRKIKHQIIGSDIHEDNPLGRILKSFEKHKTKDITTIESKLDSALIKEIPAIQAGLPMIKLIAAVAPLLGLLGTVTGMIETFQSITLFGTGDPKLMAGGISQALMTTVLGLVVAIPILFIYNILNAKAKKIIETLTQQSSALVAKYLELLHGSPESYKDTHE